jgi:hypothetical protein
MILNSPSINAIIAPILIRREDTFGSICSMSLFLQDLDINFSLGNRER